MGAEARRRDGVKRMARSDRKLLPSDSVPMPRILVVEDDLDIAELIAHYLTGAGHTVERLTSGRDVLPRLRREPADLVMLDLMLPGLDGSGSATRCGPIRRRRRFRSSC